MQTTCFNSRNKTRLLPNNVNDILGKKKKNCKMTVDTITMIHD